MSRPARRRAHRARTVLGVAAVAALTGCATAGARRASPAGAAPAVSVRSFGRFVDSLVGAPMFRNAQWGVLVVDPASGDTIYSRNAGKLFLPASNQKILTGATALAQLGPDFRFVTRFGASGPLGDGVLDGDLIVFGSGDPTFSDTAWMGDHRNAFRAMADSVAARGVRRVAGRLRGGPPAFTDQPCGFGWELDDMDAPYGACVEDLYVNEGLARERRARRNGDTATVAVAIRDARGTFLATLQAAMRERGIEIGGGIDTSRTAADTAVLRCSNCGRRPCR